MAQGLAALLTSGVVGIAKDKLASAIEEQASLLWNFRDDLEDMKETLETISAALQDAERRSVKEKLVQLWMKQLKHAALGISDMLEDYQNTRDDQATGKMPGTFSCLQTTYKKIAMANRMNSMREELRKINKKFRGFNFSPGGTSPSVEQHSYDIRETFSRLPEIPIIGRNGEKQEIINLLTAGTNNNETVIAAIHGLGGMGKSTLAQLVHNDAQFKKYDHRIWVYVSWDFNLMKIGNSIISQIDRGQTKRDTLEEINKCLDDLLRDKKILIVLDDLWEEKDTELEKLRTMLLMGKKGSCMIDVIVTTRKEDIARKVSTCKPYKLLPLNDHTCWEIIKKYSRFEDQHNQEEKEQIGLEIAKKCGGVALAARALGFMLQSKDLAGWREINDNNIWNESSEDNDGVLLSLKLSYERMPPHLRICFSYCAIFPKGHNIAEDELIHQWITLGFIDRSKGKEYIRQLLGMSFLQDSSKVPKDSQEHMARYIMHDLVHDLAKSIMRDELSYVASESSNHGQKYCRYASITKYDQAMELSNILPSNVRALHFSDSGKLDIARGAFSFAKCLRILDFSGCSSILLPASIGKLKQLKYLNAPRMQNERLPEYITKLSKLQYLNLDGSSHISALPESIGKLRCLRYLGLSGCRGISKLPESLGDLKSILHLDMLGCSGLRELPDSIGDLINLEHLELSNCLLVKPIPESFCGLSQLQYLNLSSCFFIGLLPEDIGSLVNLQYLNMSGCHIRKLPESFKKLRNLLHLDLANSHIDKGLLGALCGLTALQYLDMSCCYTKDDLHVAMRNLTDLKVLELRRCVFCTDYRNLIDSICRLTNLEHLDLSENLVKYLPESIGNLKRLHTLKLRQCYVLKSLPESIGNLKRLHTLDLFFCNSLKSLPESIGNLKRLHTLNLFNCGSLKSLPESIGGATGLKSIVLNGCLNILVDQASSILHYSLTLPIFKVRADDEGGHSNLHLLEGEEVSELHIVSLENVRSLEEAQRLKLLTKQNLLSLALAWGTYAHRLLEDLELLEELVPPMSLNKLTLQGYRSPSIPIWLMAISHHLPNLTCIELKDLLTCSNLPPLGQLQYLKILRLFDLPEVTKIDKGICGGKGAFPRLADFTVCWMYRLEEWNTTYPGEDGKEEFMFPMLDVLLVKDCPRLRLKPGPPKCRDWTIEDSDLVISSLEVVEISNHRCNSAPTTRLKIKSNCHSIRLFQHFPALQELVFRSCTNLTSLPEGIQQLSSLQSLELDACGSIYALPEWLSDLSSLKRIVIWSCGGIKSLPLCIQQLTNLEMLHIVDNRELQQWCKSEENKAKLAHIKYNLCGD